jgi:hypothetical protein
MSQPSLKARLYKILISVPPEERELLIKEIEAVLHAVAFKKIIPPSEPPPDRRHGLSGNS